MLTAIIGLLDGWMKNCIRDQSAEQGGMVALDISEPYTPSHLLEL